jgi:hypothetical protein
MKACTSPTFFVPVLYLLYPIDNQQEKNLIFEKKLKEGKK